MAAKAEELNALVQEIRDRVRARHATAADSGGIAVPLADLMPLLHARDAAEGKVASIGTVNPRPPGLVNNIVQWVKNNIARALDWHVREQVEFNRAVMNCVQATIEALNENNRALAAFGASVGPLAAEAHELRDVRNHWAQWRQDWDARLSSTQIQFLRSLSDLQGAWQHRVTLMDEQHRDSTKAHLDRLRADFEGTLERAASDIQKRMWADLEQIRREYETIIHSELRLLRQKASIARVAAPAPGVGPADIDWLKFAEKFRGSEEYVKRQLDLYLVRFAGAPGEVLDLGCGRGELLQALTGAGLKARGIELNAECAAICESKGLPVERADLFEYLAASADASLGGIAAMQLVEHLPPTRLPEFIHLAHSKLKPGALLALETPNPESLAIFAKHFYLDPTHAKPIPPALLAFYLEEAGFGRLETIRLNPAIESMPSLTGIPEEFRNDFFGPLDYVVFGRKL